EVAAIGVLRLSEIERRRPEGVVHASTVTALAVADEFPDVRRVDESTRESGVVQLVLQVAIFHAELQAVFPFRPGKVVGEEDGRIHARAGSIQGRTQAREREQIVHGGERQAAILPVRGDTGMVLRGPRASEWSRATRLQIDTVQVDRLHGAEGKAESGRVE